MFSCEINGGMVPFKKFSESGSDGGDPSILQVSEEGRLSESTYISVIKSVSLQARHQLPEVAQSHW